MNQAVRRKDSKPAPKQARAKERRAAILASARALLSEGTLNALTTTRIAAKASIPVGSVYRYFDDKSDILDCLYREAYAEIETAVVASQANIASDLNAPEVIRHMLGGFWRSAREHPTFIMLTRWANSHYSLWDVTPGRASSLFSLVEETLEKSGVILPTERKAAATRTMVTTISVLADLSIEEDDAIKAKALIDELATLLEAYVGTFGR